MLSEWSFPGVGRSFSAPNSSSSSSVISCLLKIVELWAHPIFVAFLVCLPQSKALMNRCVRKALTLTSLHHLSQGMCRFHGCHLRRPQSLPRSRTSLHKAKLD